MGTTITAGAATVSPAGVMELAYSRRSGTIAHQTLDGRVPDVTLRPVGMREGDLVYLCDDDASAREVEDLHAPHDPGTLLLASDRPHLDGMRYVVVGALRVELDPRGRRRWTVTVPYQEVTP